MRITQTAISSEVYECVVQSKGQWGRLFLSGSVLASLPLLTNAVSGYHHFRVHLFLYVLLSSLNGGSLA